ncbi:TonB-dependent receptor [Phyllobacterium phragmitis]|uniref:TonB-dependent receptor n=2 Tax=Phyllobacterium phragmitis TaxID=2670329 RepID=A0ABQ0H0C8_9HYPH
MPGWLRGGNLLTSAQLHIRLRFVMNFGAKVFRLRCTGADMKKTIVAAGFLTLMLPGTADAQENGAEASQTIMLQPILVTAGLTPVEQEKTGRAFTVITGEELEQRQIRYVADALRQVPGFAVSRTGAAGGVTQVRVRGAEANQLLVMIDGVEANEMSSGEYDFGGLLADDIDRIEILRGPQSAFWGSNAMAGVVNIITKRGERNGFTVKGRSEAGTQGTFLGGLSLSGGGENYDMALSGTWRRSDGFNISDFGSEKDGDRNATVNGRLTLELTPDLTIEGTLRYVDRRNAIDPQDFAWGSPTYGYVIDGDEETAAREFFGSLGATHVSLDGALTQKARFTGGDMHREYFQNGSRTSWNDGNRYTGSYQATYAFETPGFLGASHQITGGYEWERETFLPSHLDETLSRDTNALVAEYRGEFLDQLFLNAGIRRDWNDRFSNTVTYSLSGAWKIPDSTTRLHASVGTGITKPTFFEQFGYVPDSFTGNPDLTPEKSLGWDIGVEHGFFGGLLVADITYFNQDLTDEIITVYGGAPDYTSTVVNGDGKSRRQGVELSATLNLFDGFQAGASYTYTDATEQSAAGEKRLEEVRRPKHSGALNASYTFLDQRARVFGEVVFNGKMTDQAFVPALPARVTLDAYTVVNIGGSFRVNEHVELFGRIENLFDEDYQEIFSYNAPGRAAYIGVRGTF